jgi:hypothetical protein
MSDDIVQGAGRVEALALEADGAVVVRTSPVPRRPGGGGERLDQPVQMPLVDIDRIRHLVVSVLVHHEPDPIKASRGDDEHFEQQLAPPATPRSASPPGPTPRLMEPPAGAGPRRRPQDSVPPGCRRPRWDPHVEPPRFLG